MPSPELIQLQMHADCDQAGSSGVLEASSGLWAETRSKIASQFAQGTYEDFESALTTILPNAVSSDSLTRRSFNNYINATDAFTSSMSETLQSETKLRHFLRALIRQVALNAAYTQAALTIIRRIWNRLRDERPPTTGTYIYPLSTILNQDFRDLQIGWARVETMYSVLPHPRFANSLVHATEMTSSFRTIIGTWDELTQTVYLERSSNVRDLMKELCGLSFVHI